VAPAPWTPRQGETFEGYGQTGTITELREPETLAWTWGEEAFRFDLRSDGDGCTLTFTHVLTDSILPAQHAAGWECYLERLSAWLDGAPISEEEAHWRIGETHERYAVKFNLDPSPGRKMIASFPFRMGTLENGRRFRLERRFAYPPERVWRALTDPAELAQWFPLDGAPLEVVTSEPPELLVGTWGGDELRFELRPQGEGCSLVFTHTVGDPDAAARNAAGWDRCFARLEAHFAGVRMERETSLELWPEVHERYVEAFDAAPTRP
jgi:uncharacterized protein YndB with AHSA1/START domain